MPIVHVLQSQPLWPDLLQFPQIQMGTIVEMLFQKKYDDLQAELQHPHIAADQNRLQPSSHGAQHSCPPYLHPKGWRDPRLITP